MGFNVELKRPLGWALVDDSNPNFNIWESSAGYREAFMKYEDPRQIKPFGMNTAENDGNVRTKQIYEMYAKGVPNDSIARILGVSLSYVVQAIRKRCGGEAA